MAQVDVSCHGCLATFFIRALLKISLTIQIARSTFSSKTDEKAGRQLERGRKGEEDEKGKNSSINSLLISQELRAREQK